MKNSGFLKVSRQSHLGVHTAGPQRRMDDVLIVRRENYDWLLIRFADADVPVVFSEPGNRGVSVSEDLIKECLTGLWQLFEFIELNDGNPAGSRQMIVGL